MAEIGTSCIEVGLDLAGSVLNRGENGGSGSRVPFRSGEDPASRVAEDAGGRLCWTE